MVNVKPKIDNFLSVLAAVEHCVQESSGGQLIPTALDNLSPLHSAVFLFGCQVMQLLSNCPLFPSVLLLLAKSLPVSSSSSNEALLAHCSRDFYFDATNQILYLSEAKLHHVGHFIATILQSMAHIASGNQMESRDLMLCHSFAIIFKSTKYVIFFGNNVIFVVFFSFLNLGSKSQSFMQALHEAISALSLQLFNFSFKWNTAEVCRSHLSLAHHTLAPQVGTNNLVCFMLSFLQPKLDASEGQHGALVEEFLNIRVPNEAQFTEHLLASRLVRKIQPTAENCMPFKQIQAVG